MPRAEATKERNNFVKGLITEASPLTYPENASIDEDNFVLNRSGTRERRLGLDYEDDYALTSTGLAYSATETVAVSSHEWNNVANDASLSFLVVQIGAKLHIYNRNNITVSDNYLSTINISSHVRSGGTQGDNPVDVAFGNGVLVVAGEDFTPFYIEYNVGAETFSTSSITMQIRDFFGVEDSLDVDERPPALSDLHKFNLLNQGWTEGNLSATKAYNNGTAGGTTASFPSNADIESVALVSAEVGSSLELDPDLLNPTLFGTTPAPKGRYVIDAFNRSGDRNTLSGVAVTSDVEAGRPKAVAFYSGRVFYTGINSNVTGTEETAPNYDGYIFFTQILTNTNKIGYCYQSADPTSDEISDLVDSDGGTVQIPEAGNIFAIEQVGNSLVVLADNGVWEVKGGDSGFTASDFQIRLITTIGAINKSSVVKVEDTLVYWSTGGIYSIVADNITTLLVAKNLTQTTIQSLFNEITNVAKLYSTGVYDKVDKRIRWMYNDLSSYTGTYYNNSYNRELIFDLTLQAFSTNTIEQLDAAVPPIVVGYALSSDTVFGTREDPIVVEGDAVEVGGSPVIIDRAITTASTFSVKFITLATTSNAASGTWKMTLSEYNGIDFLDWSVANGGAGVNYTSYLLTGHELMGDTARDKQVIYLTLHYNRTETGFTDDGAGNLTAIRPSSCLVQSRGDWSNHTNSGQYQPITAYNENSVARFFQGYRLLRNYLPSGASDSFNYGYEVVTTRNKIRGKGKALSLYFTSEEGKDCQILGWSIHFSGNQR